MKEQYLEKNSEKIEEYLQADILFNIYNKMKNVDGNEELLNTIKNKYQQIYQADISKSKAKPIEALIIPKDTEINSVYINTAKKVCEYLGIKIQVNPTEEVSNKDYVIITDDQLEKNYLLNLKNAMASSFLITDLDDINMETYSKLKNSSIAENFSMVIVINKNSENEEKFSQALTALSVPPIYVPDAPIKIRPDSVVDAMKKMRKTSFVNEVPNYIKENNIRPLI